MRTKDYVIIMAGGIGSRFWPMSRSKFPKQFQDILGTGKTLIRSTFERFQEFVPDENIYVVTNGQYNNLVQEQLPEIKADQVLLEPVGRNTAPCVAYACFKIREKDPDACIFVAASDHLITNEKEFLRIAGMGLDACREEEIIVTLGIQPTRPDTGYGYIQFRDEELKEGIHKVKTFTEKPELEMARTFLESGDFLWNSGMFIFSVDTILKAFLEFLPDMHDLFESIKSSYYTDEEKASIEKIYSQCLNISIDFGIMEKAENVYVIPSSFGWSDLGTWRSVFENKEKDYFDNAVQGDVMIYESTNNVIHLARKEKLAVIEGLHNFIIVDTDDSLLICRIGQEQRIKEIVNDVKKNFDGKYT